MITTRTLSQCQAIRNVPETKYNMEVKDVDEKIEDLKKRMVAKQLLARYYESNIPIKYWKLDMNKDFSGDANLLEFYNSIKVDIEGCYRKGSSYCFAGAHGRGKTMMVTNILKRAVEKGFSGLYVNLSDVMSIMKTPDSFSARKELLQVDFLVIDEFDPRHIGSSENSSDFHGRILEDIVRNRTQNVLPIFICTNSPDPIAAFSGSIKEGMSSLWNYVKIVPVMGKDFRKNEAQ